MERFKIVTNFVFYVPQLVAIIYVLAATDEPSCDRSLRVWATLYGAWVAANLLIKCVPRATIVLRRTH